MPGLDGLRAVAVLAVVAYHLGFGWAPGGLLGVGVFFTLSGYLITDLLLDQAGRGGISLPSFWLARARRLLPGLFVMLVVVAAWVTVIGPHQPEDFRSAVSSAAFYVNNWWLIVRDVSYFAAFEQPGPLNHLWSLSVEEQFYIVWPLVIVLGVRAVPEAAYGTRPRLGAACLVLAVASAVLMAVVFRPGIDPSRVYYGTDTRAFELLVGAALAMVWPSQRLKAGIAPAAGRMLDACGALGLAVVLLLVWQTDPYAPFLYRGGLVLLSCATVLIIVAVVHPASRLGVALGRRPLRWVGERSYGIYLWHFPIIVLTTPAAARGPDLARAAAQVAATLVVAALSWRYVEDPIRHGGLRRLGETLDPRRWRRRPPPVPARVAAVASVFVLAGAAAGMGGVNLEGTGGAQPGDLTVSRTVTRPVAATAPSAKAASCDAVVHIGDSTSEGLVSAAYLPKPKWRISARYAQVGARTQHFEISGARSIYEHFNGIPNAREVAQSWRRKGFDGCWVLALGTNEAANVSAGSDYGFANRIDAMMAVIGDEPALWVNVRTLRRSGPYRASNMDDWNATLLDACDRYPNMRVYDWASDVRDDWFIADGIHFTTPGYRERSRRIARALLTAFPENRPVERSSAPCVVRPDGGTS
jgi:peptidoglycan/LPS O-acetylase OafA/YrhL